MEFPIEKIRNQQKETWNKFSPGWKKWDGLAMEFIKPMGDEIIKYLNPTDGETILDVAAGTGEPGLTIAAMIPNGKVLITDLAEGMLEVARENTMRRGAMNVEILACDAGDMPFEDNTFNGVSCRFGFMFFPDMLLAATEMARLLKPGGRVATTVWGASVKNLWATACMSIINKNMDIPAPPLDAPGLFRCAQSGIVMDLFKEAGLNNVTEAEVTTKLVCDTIETYWGFITEVVAPVSAALGKADDALKAKIKQEVFELLIQKYPDGKVSIPGSALIICGEK